MKKIMLLGTVSLLAGCAMTMSEFSEQMTAKWAGRSYDEFVMEKGIAKDSYQLSNGMTMYRHEGEGVRGPYGKASHCTLNVLVDNQNNITSFKVGDGSNYCRNFLN